MTAKLGILAGGGHLPVLIMAACLESNRPFHVLTFKGQPAPEVPPPAAHHTMCPPGALGKMLKTLQEQGVRQVVMAGHVRKPSLFDLRPDVEGVKFLASVVSRHDDALLTHLCRYWESKGFEVLSPADIVPNLTLAPGACGKHTPSAAQQADIQIGAQVLAALGGLDIGQACVVKDGVVLGVEAIEGTDELLRRCAPLRGESNKGGVLVKGAKPGQNLKVDMPVIGAATLSLLNELRYAGVAVESGRTLLLDRETALEIANFNGLFIYGYTR